MVVLDGRGNELRSQFERLQGYLHEPAGNGGRPVIMQGPGKEDVEAFMAATNLEDAYRGPELDAFLGSEEEGGSPEQGRRMRDEGLRREGEFGDRQVGGSEEGTGGRRVGEGGREVVEQGLSLALSAAPILKEMHAEHAEGDEAGQGAVQGRQQQQWPVESKDNEAFPLSVGTGAAEQQQQQQYQYPAPSPASSRDSRPEVAPQGGERKLPLVVPSPPPAANGQSEREFDQSQQDLTSQSQEQGGSDSEDVGFSAEEREGRARALLNAPGVDAASGVRGWRRQRVGGHRDDEPKLSIMQDVLSAVFGWQVASGKGPRGHGVVGRRRSGREAMAGRGPSGSSVMYA